MHILLLFQILRQGTGIFSIDDLIILLYRMLVSCANNLVIHCLDFLILLFVFRFEKLDITPKSAQKIKPVLERWMKEAEDRLVLKLNYGLSKQTFSFLEWNCYGILYILKIQTLFFPLALKRMPNTLKCRPREQSGVE